MKAIIFDLDGIVVDTAKYHYMAWKNLASDMGFEFSENQNEQLKGISRVKSLEILLDIGGVEITNQKKEQLLKEKNKEYLSYVNKMTPKDILPGISKLLSYLEFEKIPFALGSASKNATLILKKVGLLNKFSAISDGNNVTRAKPDPEVFLLAAKKMNIVPYKCIVIEDAVAGIKAAKNAGMTAIAVGDNSIFQEADFVLNNTKELTPNFIKKVMDIND